MFPINDIFYLTKVVILPIILNKKEIRFMTIKRDLYLERLINRMNNGMIKVVTGVRRSGKSYLLFNLFYDYLIKKDVKKENILMVELDNIVNKALRTAETLYKHITSKIAKEGTNYVILDEIQYVNDFPELLNGLLHIENMDIYVTGSNSKFLSSDILTEFRGRGDEVRINPLSFREFYSVYDGSFEKAFDEYMVFGGLPKIIDMKTNEQKINYLKNLFSETYIKDTLERNHIRKNGEFEDIINILASSVGSLSNPSKLEATFKSIKKSKITRNTIENYIEYLKEAFIIRESLRYDVKGKKYISTPVKYYFVDTGLRNARLGFRQIEETHLMENIIYNDLVINGYNVDVGLIPIREKNKKGQFTRKNIEIDFIANKGMDRIYIQSAYALPTEEKKIQEKRPLLNTSDSFEKMIIIKDDIIPRIDENGIKIVGLKDFLLKN